VANIPSENFTHLLASFADVNPTTYEVTFPKGFEVQFSTFTQTVQIRKKEVKTLISIGGDYCRSFPSMVRKPDTRKAFIASSIRLARNKNFHGLCLNWLYPSTQDEMNKLGTLLGEWREAVDQESDWTGTDKLLLVAAVCYRPEHKSLWYPIQEISDNLDWINVLGYDYYSPVLSRDVTGPFAALHDVETSAAPNKYRCGDFGINEWLDNTVCRLDPNKIVFGLPFYVYAWRLQDESDANTGFFAPADGEANGVFINP
jgi:chitinase